MTAVKTDTRITTPYLTAPFDAYANFGLFLPSCFQRSPFKDQQTYISTTSAVASSRVGTCIRSACFRNSLSLLGKGW